MRPVLLFDLDGTLVDSAEGIHRSLNHALAQVNMSPILRESARDYIGPPLDISLRERLGLQGERFQIVWDSFAEYYRKIGLRYTEAVPGMPRLCQLLKETGFRLGVATNKPWAYCAPILERCGYSHCFEVISGSFHNGVPEEKSAVIREALRLLKISPEQALMIGDRGQDAAGARACGVSCLGVDFCGYAEPRELEDAGAICVFHRVEELQRYLLAL